MATWVIGDVHGCHATLEALLATIELDAKRDRLWMVGDLINRGPSSLAVLRWARRCEEVMGERFVVVLGNHDLHLVTRASGLRSPGRLDTLAEALAAPDLAEMLDWIRARPLLHREQGHVLVHAGLLPEWSLARAEELARAVEACLRAEDWRQLFASDEGEQRRQLRAALSAFTRLRTCRESGDPCPFSGNPREAPEGCHPWFELPGRWRSRTPILFGHWAALGLFRGDGVTCLDSGCVWGRRLSALCLESGRVVQVDSLEVGTKRRPERSLQSS